MNSHAPACQCVVCAGADWKAIARKVQANIRTYGFHVMYIPDAQPAYGYTIGLSLKQHRELVLFGLPYRTTGDLLANAYRRLKTTGLAPNVGYHDISQFYTVYFREIHPSHLVETFKYGYHYLSANHGVSLEAILPYQLVWPDAQNNAPWQMGYDPNMRAFQPELWTAQEATV